MHNDTRSGITLLAGGWKLKISHATVDDTARYSCSAVSVAGETEKFFDLVVLGMYSEALPYVLFTKVLPYYSIRFKNHTRYNILCSIQSIIM